MTRNEAREILMQILYEMDASKSMDTEIAEGLAHERLKGVNAQRGTQLLCSILENLDAIDSSINEKSRSWKTGRMPKVDLAIMRLAIGEIRFDDTVPQAVAINEAVNLAKKFSMEKSSGFINGVLGAIVNQDEK